MPCGIPNKSKSIEKQKCEHCGQFFNSKGLKKHEKSYLTKTNAQKRAQELDDQIQKQESKCDMLNLSLD